MGETADSMKLFRWDNVDEDEDDNDDGGDDDDHDDDIVRS